MFLLVEDYIIVVTIIITLCIQYFADVQFVLGEIKLDDDQKHEYRRYVLKTTAVIFPIQIMLVVKLFYGQRWACGKEKKTRNSFIAYYRMGLTANSATILSCLM